MNTVVFEELGVEVGQEYFGKAIGRVVRSVNIGEDEVFVANVMLYPLEVLWKQRG